ncbi:MAG TPA: hypothetical protein VIO36_10405 [Anaerolineaceae bacterium]
MGRHSQYDFHEKKVDRNEIHPIWRMIGFAMMLLIPFLSYIAAIGILQENAKQRWFPIPADLLVPWGSDSMLGIKILLTLVIAFLLYMIFMLITFIMNRLFAPPRYGPTDVPQVTYRGKKRVR